eukprot:13271-Chlamydomonas_euryale.AAC.3
MRVYGGRVGSGWVPHIPYVCVGRRSLAQPGKLEKVGVDTVKTFCKEFYRIHVWMSGEGGGGGTPMRTGRRGEGGWDNPPRGGGREKEIGPTRLVRAGCRGRRGNPTAQKIKKIKAWAAAATATAVPETNIRPTCSITSTPHGIVTASGWYGGAPLGSFLTAIAPVCAHGPAAHHIGLNNFSDGHSSTTRLRALNACGHTWACCGWPATRFLACTPSFFYGCQNRGRRC